MCVVTQNNRLLHEFDFKYRLSRSGRSATFSKSVKLDIQPRRAPHARGTRHSIIYSFKYNQQDATLYNILYYCQCLLLPLAVAADAVSTVFELLMMVGETA
jgi:hypothetical protein